MATNLFSYLHRLDKAGLDTIYAEPVPEGGPGRAIMGRLRRATGEYDQNSVFCIGEVERLLCGGKRQCGEVIELRKD